MRMGAIGLVARNKATFQLTIGNSRIKVTTVAPHSQTFDGSLYSACPVLNIIAVDTRVPSANNASRTGDYHFITISKIQSFQITSPSTANGSDSSITKAVPTIGPVDLKRLKQREEERIRKLKEEEQDKGKGVTKEAQAIFDSFKRMWVKALLHCDLRNTANLSFQQHANPLAQPGDDCSRSRHHCAPIPRRGLQGRQGQTGSLEPCEEGPRGRAAQAQREGDSQCLHSAKERRIESAANNCYKSFPRFSIRSNIRRRGSDSSVLLLCIVDGMLRLASESNDTHIMKLFMSNPTDSNICRFLRGFFFLFHVNTIRM